MICDRVQADVSRTMDEGGPLAPESARHLAVCAECDAFRTESIDLARRYAEEVRAGLSRLRGSAPGEMPASRRRPVALLLATAAAILLVWGGRGIVPSGAPASIAPIVAERRVSPASRVGLSESPMLPEREELSFLERDVLPVRLDEDLLPVPPDSAEIRLPTSLRF